MTENDPTNGGRGTGDQSPWPPEEFSPGPGERYPTSHMEREQWMGLVNDERKQAFAPWGDKDHPAAKGGKDARWKWKLEDNYVTGARARAALDARVAFEYDKLDGLVYIQREEDPHLYVDYDDVVDPETGDVHPAARAFISHLGPTYMDISVSGSGLHQVFVGDLPDDVTAAGWLLDEEPWGSNDDEPAIEIYSGDRLLAMSGKHVAGTPTTATEVDEDLLETILDANGELPEPDQYPERETVDLDDYEPTATQSNEYTEHIEDIFAALERLDARDVAERTIVHRWNDDASTSEGARAFYPTWGPNSNGTANVVNEHGWVDTGPEGGEGGPTVMALIDMGALSHRQADRRSARGPLFFEAVGHLRDLGFSIPKLVRDVGGDASDFRERHLTDLPATPVTKRALSTWQPDRRGQDGLTQNAVYDRVHEEIAQAQAEGEHALIDALMGTGKTYSVFKNAAETGEPVTYLSPRHDTMDQAEEFCESMGRRYCRLPSAPRDCPTFQGEHGDEWRKIVWGPYNLGARPSKLHERMDLPCHEEVAGGHCPYMAKNVDDVDQFDVVIGHYRHGYLPHITAGRHVVVDEYDRDAMWTQMAADDLQQWVNCWLEAHDEFPYDHIQELRNDAHHECPCKDEALAWFEENPPDEDEEAALQEAYHAHTAKAVYTILAATPVGGVDYGYSRAFIPGEDRRKGVYYFGDGHEPEKVILQTPPGFGYSRSVLCLDGTPEPTAWESLLDLHLKRRRVLDDEERQEFLRDVQGLVFVQANEHAKPYSSGEWVTPKKDAALFSAMAEQYGEKPLVFAPKKAIEKYEREGVDEYAKEMDNYANLRGTNRYSEEKLLAVSGSSHWGDQWVRTLAAMQGIAVQPEGKGMDRDYGTGDRYVKLMREAVVAQSALRVGRGDTGAIVVLNTAASPEWLPIEHHTSVTTVWTDNQQDILLAMRDLAGSDSVTVSDIHAHERVGCTRRTVARTIHKFAEFDYIDIEHRGTGRPMVARDDGLHRVSEAGEVELPTTDLEALVAPGGGGGSEVDNLHIVSNMGFVHPNGADNVGTPRHEHDLYEIEKEPDGYALKTIGPPG